MRAPSLPFLLALFLIGNTALSFGPFPLSWKLLIFLATLLLPGLAAYPSTLGKKGPRPEEAQNFRIPLWAWALLWAFTILLHLYRLTTLSPWPLFDEALHGYLALELAWGQELRMFYTPSQFPPFFIWGLGLFFKIFPPSLFSLWLYPAVLSLATAGLGSLAARYFLPARPAFFFFILSAFSFWPLLQGRFCHAGVLVLFWEYLCLTAAGWVLKSNNDGRLSWKWSLFGSATGLGFYVFTSWSAVAVVLALLAWGMAREKGWPVKTLGFFAVPVVLLAAPYFILLALDPDWGRYMGSLVTAPGASGSFGDQATTSLSYFTALIWGPLKGSYYTPNWGGFLNPLLGAFFWLGLGLFFKDRRSFWMKWGIVSFLLLMAPGFLSGNVECFRIIQVLPLLLWVTVMGLEALWGQLQGKMRYLVFALLFAVSLRLDCYHLFQVCPQAWAQGGGEFYNEQGLKFFPSSGAYSVLKAIADQDGPGFILADLMAPPDPSLIVSTYPFNATLNPALAKSQPAWAALLCNENLQPFLQKRFPEAQAFTLPPGWDGDPDGAWMLVVLKIDLSTAVSFARFLQADKAMGDIRSMQMHLGIQASHQAILQALSERYAVFQGDPFLENFFWRSVYLHESADRDLTGSYLALKRALHSGYTSADLYNEMGYMDYLRGDLKAARKDYEQAVHCPVNHTSAAANLKVLAGR